MEKPNLYESLKILRESGILLEKKLRSEMTPEELADARVKSKKRREARKLAAAEKRGYEKGMRDKLTADYKAAQVKEPEAKEPEAKEPEAIQDKSKEVPKYRIGSLEDFRANRNNPDFLKYLDGAKSIDRYLAEKFVDVVFEAWRKNVPISNIGKLLKKWYIEDLSSDERREYWY